MDVYDWDFASQVVNAATECDCLSLRKKIDTPYLLAVCSYFEERIKVFEEGKTPQVDFVVILGHAFIKSSRLTMNSDLAVRTIFGALREVAIEIRILLATKEIEPNDYIIDTCKKTRDFLVKLSDEGRAAYQALYPGSMSRW